MSLTTSILTGGTHSHQTTSEEVNFLRTDLQAAGVVGALTNTAGVAPATGGFAMNAQGSPDMTVAASAGVVIVTATPTGGNSQKLRVKNSASSNVTISANATGGTRYDWLYVKVDPDAAANPAADASDVATLVTSRSTSATTDNGTPPTYGTLLAVVTVANGASSISNGNIADKRVRSGAIGALNDENGNEIIKVSATASAVNELTGVNAATGTAPQLNATGDDTNIDLRFNAKGTGTMQLGRPVAFYGTTTTSTTDGSSTDLTSYTEIFDYGSNFASGVFTAPYTGVYHFNVVMSFLNITSASARIDSNLKVNGSSVAHGHGTANTGTADPTANFSITINLTAGDTVQVEVSNNTGGTEALERSSFSGHMIGRTA